MSISYEIITYHSTNSLWCFEILEHFWSFFFGSVLKHTHAPDRLSTLYKLVICQPNTWFSLFKRSHARSHLQGLRSHNLTCRFTERLKLPSHQDTFWVATELTHSNHNGNRNIKHKEILAFDSKAFIKYKLNTYKRIYT